MALPPPGRLPATLRPAMIRLNDLVEHQLTRGHLPPIKPFTYAFPYTRARNDTWFFTFSACKHQQPSESCSLLRLARPTLLPAAHSVCA